MRLNRYIATYSDYSRRKADNLIEEGRVIVNRATAHMGMDVTEKDTVLIDGKKLFPFKREPITVLVNKPTGYVCSKDGQGSPTVYDLLQKRMQHLNIAGRLDKDSSGLVVLTDDGDLLQQLTHPSNNKDKVYIVRLNRPLTSSDSAKIRQGIIIDDGQPSKMVVKSLPDNTYQITLHEGRNRQIRRTFEAIRYKVSKLQRIKLGPYELGDLKESDFLEI